MKRILIRTLTILLLLFISAGVVYAHARLVKANPAPGSVIGQGPTQVQLWYDQAVDPQFSEVQVLDNSRARVDTSQLQVASNDPKSLEVPLKPLGDGTYSVVWKAFSADDGHITRGVFAFTVGTVAGPVVNPIDVNGDEPSELSPLSAVARGISLMALLALVGGFFFRIFLLNRSLQSVGVNPNLVDARWKQLSAVALILAFVASAFELVLEANLVANAISVQSVADILFDTRFGALWLIRIFLLIVAATVLFAQTRRARFAIPGISLGVFIVLFIIANSLSLTRGLFLASLFGAQGLTPAQLIYLYLHHLGLFVPFVLFFGIAFYQRYTLIGILPLVGTFALLTRALEGHGVAAQGDLSIAFFSDWLHLIAVSLWVGGLFNFAFLMPYVWRALDPQTRSKWIARMVPTFSTAAIGATITIAITGLYNTLIEIPAYDDALRNFKIPPLDTFIGDIYSSTLTIKVVLFGVMIAFGAVNLLFISPRFRRAIAAPETSARLFSRFRLTVAAEVLLGVSAIFLAGLLTLEPPTRSLAAPEGPSVAKNNTSAPLLLVGDADTHVHVQLTLGPNPDAPAQLDALVTDPATATTQAPNGQPTADVLRVIFNFTLLDSDQGIQNINADAKPDGHYVLNGNYFPLDGMWRVRVTVRRKGVEDVSVDFAYYVAPQNANKPDDIQARALLNQSQQRMNQLRSLHSVQQLNDGANGVVVTDYDYQAPDRLRFNVEGQGVSIAIGGQQYYQDKAGQWTARARVDPFAFPTFDFATQAQSVELGRAENVAGQSAQIVRFFTAGSGGGSVINYAYWLSTRDLRVLQFAMVTDAHYMMQYYSDFDGGDIAINAPANVIVSTPVAVAPVSPNSGTNSPAPITTNTRPRGFITGDLEGDGALVLLVAGIVIGLIGTAQRRARNARLVSLALAVVFAVAGIGLFVDAMNGVAAAASNVSVDPTRSSRGQLLYQQDCAVCHGVTGHGDGPGGANLPVKPFDLTTHVLLHDEQYLYAVILNGRGYMPAWGDKLTQDQIYDVIAYIRKLALDAQKQNAKPGFTPQP